MSKTFFVVTDTNTNSKSRITEHASEAEGFARMQTRETSEYSATTLFVCSADADDQINGVVSIFHDGKKYAPEK